MAFTEISRNSSIVTRTTAQTATDAKFLPIAPTAGQWIVVALYTNQGIIPAFPVSGANNQVTNVTCGTTTKVSLSLLESGLSTSINAPTVFIAPYQTGMDTRVEITWTNGIASTIMGVAIMVFSGSVAGASSNYVQYRLDNANGALDGSGNYAAGVGLTQAASTNGVIAWANSSAVQTNYDTQGEVFIAAMACTASFNVNQPRQLGASGAVVDASGNVTTAGQATGTIVISNATSVVSSGSGVIYSPSGNFIFTYTGSNTTTNTLTGCVASTAAAGASVPGYCQMMLSGNSTSNISAVVPINSYPITAVSASGSVVTYTCANVFTAGTQVTIIGVTGGTGGSPYSGTYTIASANSSQFTVNNTRTGAATLTAALASPAAGTLGGFQTGNSTAYTGASTANGHIQTAITGGTTPARLDLMLGSNVAGTTSVKAYGSAKISGTNTSVAGGFIYTMVPATRTMTRASLATNFRRSLAAKSKTFPRLASAAHYRAARAVKAVSAVRTASATHFRAAVAAKLTNRVRISRATHYHAAVVGKRSNFVRTSSANQLAAARVTKQVAVIRGVVVTANYAIATSRTRTLARRAVATAVGFARAVKGIVSHTHPGQVAGAFSVAQVRGKFLSASVEADVTTAKVAAKAKFLVKE